MKDKIKTVIPQFSTRRMVKEYVERFYVPALKWPVFNFLFSPSAWLIMLMIFCLRVTDMPLDTLRMLFVVRGRKGIAWTLDVFLQPGFTSLPLPLSNLGNPLTILVTSRLCHRQCGRHVDRRAPRHRAYSNEHCQFNARCGAGASLA